MTEEKTMDWVDHVIARSEDFEECLKTHWTDDSFGWGAVLRHLWNEPADTRPNGLLLTGPEGCGRHTAAAHMVRFLHEKNFGSVWLTGDELLAEGGVPAARERLDALLDDFWEKDKGLCLVVEHLEELPGRRELLDYLGKILWDYWLARETRSAASRLFLILIDSGRGIPSLLRERLQRSRMTLPDQQYRRSFLDNKALDLAGYVDFDDCAAYAEGLTYAQMVNLIRDLRMLVDETDAEVSREWLKQIVEEQREEPSDARLVRRQTAAEEPIDGGNQANRSEFAQTDASGPKPVEMEQEKLCGITKEMPEEKSVYELIVELFGEEEGKRLIQGVQQDETDVEKPLDGTDTNTEKWQDETDVEKPQDNRNVQDLRSDLPREKRVKRTQPKKKAADVRATRKKPEKSTAKNRLAKLFGVQKAKRAIKKKRRSQTAAARKTVDKDRS